MKKLLTVLLALAIVFTYSIPAVFADTAATDANKSDAKTAVTTAINTYFGAMTWDATLKLKTIPTADSSKGTPNADLTQTAVRTTLNTIITDYSNKIDAASTVEAIKVLTDAVGVGGTGATSTATLMEAMLFTAGGPYYTTLYTNAVSEAKAAAQAYMDKVDPAQYAESNAATIKADKVLLSNAIATATNDPAGLALVMSKAYATGDATMSLKGTNGFAPTVEAMTKTSDAAVALIKAKTDAQNAVATIAGTFQTKEAARLAVIAKATTTATVTAVAQADAAAKATALSSNVYMVQKYFNDFIEGVKADDSTTWNGKASAAAAVTDYQSKAATAFEFTEDLAAINAMTGDQAVNKATALSNQDHFYYILSQLGGVQVLTQYAETFANGLKAQYDVTTGLAMYNPATVDARLADVKADISSLKLTSTAAVAAAFNGVKTAAEEAKGLVAYKSDAYARISMSAGFPNVSTMAADVVNGTSLVKLEGKYAASEWDDSTDFVKAVKAIQSDYKTKINAAASKADILALVKEAQAKMDAVGLRNTAAASVKIQIKANLVNMGYAGATADFTNNTGSTLGTIDSYAKSKNIGGVYSTEIVNAAEWAAVDVLTNAVLAKNSTTLTNTEIQTILKDSYPAALAKIDGMKTTADLKTAGDALVAAIKALPINVTLADKDKYLAVEKQYEDFMAFPGAARTSLSNYSLLQADMTRLIALEKDQVFLMINKLPSTIAVTDQKAVADARAAVDAYDKAYSGYATSAKNADYSYGYVEVSNLSTLEKAEAALSTARVIDAAKQIAALPATITMKDIAAVQAARKAYDALNDAEKSVFSKALLDKLVAAEKSVVDENINATKSLKITAASVASKGKIKVTWKVNGTIVTGVKYQVYRSTHKTYGYKFMKTTSLKSYANTTNLKKGKVYYYKVRAYLTVDGVKYFSDWSNKAFRAAK